MRRNHRRSHMSSYPKRGSAVVTDPSSLYTTCQRITSEIYQDLFFCLQFLFLLRLISWQVYGSMWLIRHTCDIVMHIQRSVSLCQILLIEKPSDVVCAQLRGMIIILEFSKLLIYLLSICFLQRKFIVLNKKKVQFLIIYFNS